MRKRDFSAERSIHPPVVATLGSGREETANGEEERTGSAARRQRLEPTITRGCRSSREMALPARRLSGDTSRANEPFSKFHHRRYRFRVPPSGFVSLSVRRRRVGSRRVASRLAINVSRFTSRGSSRVRDLVVPPLLRSRVVVYRTAIRRRRNVSLRLDRVAG